MTIINIAIAFIAMTISAVAGFWFQDREWPIRDLRVDAMTPVAKPGEAVKIRHHFIRQRTCHVQLEQFVFDGEGVRHIAPTEDYLAAPGGPGEEDFATLVRLPPEASEGTARYRAVRLYYCNPIHHWLSWPIVVVSGDVRFQIKR
jgi:hypothetical protein